MNKNTILVGIMALAMGIAGTYAYTSNMNYEKTDDSKEGMHMMSDGTMMGNQSKDMSMDSMMMDMVANMKGKSGKELEKVFLTDMIPHHQGAVDMAKLLLEDKSVRPELVQFANAIIAAQESEISQMREWLKSY
jgi:uncharacterized protein (DUF305 family)